METIDLAASPTPAQMNMELRTGIDLDVWTQMEMGLATSMICFQMILIYGKTRIEMGFRMISMPSPTIQANGLTRMETVTGIILLMRPQIASSMMERNGPT